MPEPPSAEAVSATMKQLTTWGMLEKPRAAASKSSDQLLTPLGYHCARIPLEVRLAKTLIYGAILRYVASIKPSVQCFKVTCWCCFMGSCFDSVCTIVAGLSGRSVFRHPSSAREEAAAAHEQFAWDRSDFLPIVKVR